MSLKLYWTASVAFPILFIFSLIGQEEMSFDPPWGATFVLALYFITAWFYNRAGRKIERKETEGRPAFMSHHELPAFMKEGDEFEVITGGIITQDVSGFLLGPLQGDHYLIVRLREGEKTTEAYFVWTPAIFSLPRRFVIKRIHGGTAKYQFGITLP